MKDRFVQHMKYVLWMIKCAKSGLQILIDFNGMSTHLESFYV